MCTSSIPTSICAGITIGNKILVVHFQEPIVYSCLKAFINLKRSEKLDFASMKSAFKERFHGCEFPDRPPNGIEVDLFL